MSDSKQRLQYERDALFAECMFLRDVILGLQNGDAEAVRVASLIAQQQAEIRGPQVAAGSGDPVLSRPEPAAATSP